MRNELTIARANERQAWENLHNAQNLQGYITHNHIYADSLTSIIDALANHWHNCYDLLQLHEQAALEEQRDSANEHTIYDKRYQW